MYKLNWIFIRMFPFKCYPPKSIVIGIQSLQEVKSKKGGVEKERMKKESNQIRKRDDGRKTWRHATSFEQDASSKMIYRIFVYLKIWQPPPLPASHPHPLTLIRFLTLMNVIRIQFSELLTGEEMSFIKVVVKPRLVVPGNSNWSFGNAAKFPIGLNCLNNALCRIVYCLLSSLIFKSIV